MSYVETMRPDMTKTHARPAQLIAMHGAFGSGKDTVAARLVRQHGFTRLAFADRLKELCEIQNPIVTYRLDLQFREALLNGEDPSLRPVRLTEVVAQIGWDEAKKRYPEVRRAQQVLATDVVRNEIDPAYWVNFVEQQIEDGGKYVITDLRFPNEWEMVDRLGGQCWWVERPGHDYGADSRAKGHVSEAFHPPRFCKVINGYDIAELWAKVDVAVDGGGFAALEQLAS